MIILNQIKRQSAFRKTVREIQQKPLKIALDSGVYPGDAAKIARRAVYSQ